LLKKIITVLVVFFLTLTAIEVFLRILQPDGAEQIPAFIVDEQTGWARSPNQHGFVVQRLPGIFRTRFQTNSLGMRDREYPLEKHGKLRILALGDSMTEGWGAEQDETFPKVLESQYLRDVEVWNLGVVGYGTDQELQQLRRVIENYQPDIVILEFVFNDLHDNTVGRATWWLNYVKPHFAIQGDQLVLTNAQALAQQKAEADRKARTASAQLRAALNHLAVYRLTRYAWWTVRDSWRGFRNPVQPPPQRGPSRDWYAIDNLYRVAQNDSLNQAWTLAERLLVEINRLCASHGVKFVLTYAPAAWDGYPDTLPITVKRMGLTDPPSEFDVTILERRLAQAAERNDIRFVEMGSRFRATASPAQLYLPKAPQDSHVPGITN
jgi:lysophospholipase L1-like esterase